MTTHPTRSHDNDDDDDDDGRTRGYEEKCPRNVVQCLLGYSVSLFMFHFVILTPSFRYSYYHHDDASNTTTHHNAPDTMTRRHDDDTEQMKWYM